jgi:hypothetical protein
MEMELEFVEPPKAKTPFVVVLLLLAAFTFSYLGAYALPEALASQNMIKRWDPGHDPRPQWMAVTFVVLTVFFLASGAIARLLSSRQFKQLDSLADA